MNTVPPNSAFTGQLPEFNPIPLAQQIKMFDTAASIHAIIDAIAKGTLKPQHVNWESMRHDTQWLTRALKGPWPPDIGK